MPGTVRQDSGKWTAYYANGCPVMDEEGIPIAWATEDDAWRVVGGRSAMPSNPTARERAAEWFFDLGISLTPQRIDAFLDAERAAREDEREQCAKIAEGGSFLHDDAPDARFGKACAAAIRARKETP